MFHDMPRAIRDRMAYLEKLDAKDRADGTERMQRLRQIPPETGRFIAKLAASAPKGMFIEIGTSAGYSALWLTLACRMEGRRLTTIELLPEKIVLAKETFRLTGVDDIVELVEGDALELLPDFSDIAFCFLDTEKELYAACYELVADRLVPGGILAADNVISHAETLKPVVDRAKSDPRVVSKVDPVGKGVLVCRRV